MKHLTFHSNLKLVTEGEICLAIARSKATSARSDGKLKSIAENRTGDESSENEFGVTLGRVDTIGMSAKQNDKPRCVSTVLACLPTG